MWAVVRRKESFWEMRGEALGIFKLSNQHVCTIVNTCFRIVHQAGSKGELLQQIARHTMHELVKCIFSHLQEVGNTDHALVNGSTNLKQEV